MLGGKGIDDDLQGYAVEPLAIEVGFLEVLG